MLPNPQESIDVVAADASRQGCVEPQPPRAFRWSRPPWQACVAMVIVLGIGGWLGSVVRDANEKRNRVTCAANLKQIGLAILLYSNENHVGYPDSMETLARHAFSNGTISPSVFVCPSSNDARPESPDAAERGSYRLTADSMPSTVRWREAARGGGFIYTSIGPIDCVAIEVPGHHHDGVHILLPSGSVEFRKLSDLRSATWADLQDDVVHGRPIRWPASQPVR